MSSETKSRAGDDMRVKLMETIIHAIDREGYTGVARPQMDEFLHWDEPYVAKSSSSADTGGREAGPPTVDEIAEAMADAGLWEGAWKGMCEAERNVTRQRAEGVYAMLVRRSADTGTTGAEGLGGTHNPIVSKAAQRIESYLRPKTFNTNTFDCSIYSVVQDALVEAATQRAPVTPPAEQLGLCDRHRWLHPKDQGPSLPPFQFPCENWAAPAPVTTLGRDEALTIAILTRKSNVSGHSNASFAHGYTMACDDILKALLVAKEPRG